LLLPEIFIVEGGLVPAVPLYPSLQIGFHYD
jgi:hypothetical protein